MNKIIHTIGWVLMVVEAVALVFLIWSWCDAKRRNRDGN